MSDALFAVGADPADELAKILRLPEIAVDRGEANVGDLIEAGQGFHHEAADHVAGDLGLAGALELADDRVDDTLDALGLDRSRLPEITDEPAGRWFPALGDGAAANAGVDCLTRGRACLMVGTSGAFRTAYETEAPEPRPRLFLYRLDERRVVEGGALSDGGNLYAWLEKTLRLGGTRGIAGRPPAVHGLTFLTLLGGERSPNWNARARGAIAGLSFDTSAQDLLQAALEGVAFRFAELAELMPEVREIVAAGHALAVDGDWVQILADVLERPLAVSALDEASARGAAVVALERLGAKPDEPAVARVVEPRPERFEALREARARQRALYEQVA